MLHSGPVDVPVRTTRHRRGECAADNLWPHDPDWMGSQVYRNTPGYCDTLRATTQVSGWAYNAARDTEYDPAAPPTWGRPYCKRWWEDASAGLREKLINGPMPHRLAFFQVSWLPSHRPGQRTAE